MKSVQLSQTVEKDGEIHLSKLPFKKGAQVRVIVIEEFEEPEKPFMTAEDLLKSGLVGLWEDRADLPDSPEFARQLREQIQNRQSRP